MSAKKLNREQDERNFAGRPALNSWHFEVLGGEIMKRAFLTSTVVTSARPGKRHARLNPSATAAFHSPVKCNVAKTISTCDGHPPYPS